MVLKDQAYILFMSLGTNKAQKLGYDQVHMLYHDGSSTRTTELPSKSGTSDILGETPNELAVFCAVNHTKPSLLPYPTGATRISPLDGRKAELWRGFVMHWALPLLRIRNPPLR